ncbi:MAG: pyridoxal phosphate-dependent class II aminotransferase [Bacteroidaceae bacterium]|nr:pyridoxal phosphate-dependent class II aminotransferase [Bacteroidaceae bacterium]
MLSGHGDDIYNYSGIRMNFSSNIYAHANLTGLEAHLCSHIDLIRSYPEPSPRSLEEMMAEKYGISPDEVLVTSGATDAIYLIAQTFREKGTFKVLPPTFSEFEDACRLFGYEETDDASLCWLCNPNNPTGEVFDLSFVQDLATKHDLLVLDQSYENYTLSPLLTPQEAVQMGNVLQLHSMTKQYAIPGIRLGYVIASSSLIAALRQQVRPWAVNALAIEAGKWLLIHAQQVIPDLPSYLAETQRLLQRLEVLDGITTFDTATNFFLCTIHPESAAALKSYLARQHGILIRDASNFRGLTSHHFRIATQSPYENDTLVDAISQYLRRP